MAIEYADYLYGRCTVCLEDKEIVLIRQKPTNFISVYICTDCIQQLYHIFEHKPNMELPSKRKVRA